MEIKENKIKKAMITIRKKLDGTEMSDEDKEAWDTILVYVRESFIRKRIRKLME